MNETKTYEIKLTEEGEFFINEVLIKEKVTQEELHEYQIRERKEQINSLIDWISEIGMEHSRQNDKSLMKEDLKYLIGLSDEFILSSINTNDYIAKSDNEARFNLICKEILEINEATKWMNLK